jgi:hypothetical protein
MFANQCCKKRMKEKEILISMREFEIKGLDNVS